MPRGKRKTRTETPVDSAEIVSMPGEAIPATALEDPSHVATALDEVVERAGLTTADQLPSHVERHRPEGPANRDPKEPRAVYVSLKNGFRLEQNGPFRRFIFDEKPPEAVISDLRDAGFHYVPADKAWTAAASYEIRDASDKLALAIDGKDISHAQAR